MLLLCSVAPPLSGARLELGVAVTPARPRPCVQELHLKRVSQRLEVSGSQSDGHIREQKRKTTQHYAEQPWSPRQTTGDSRAFTRFAEGSWKAPPLQDCVGKSLEPCPLHGHSRRPTACVGAKARPISARWFEGSGYQERHVGHRHAHAAVPPAVSRRGSWRTRVNPAFRVSGTTV